MVVLLRREYALLVAAAVQFGALFIAIRQQSKYGWLAALSLVAVIALFAWLFALRRSRTISDTPTSKIASAAQGYVELLGRGAAHGNSQILSPYTQLPCLWYRYFVYRREDNKWVYDHSLESNQFFEIDDGTGRCIVDPEGAEILSDRKETRQVGDYKHVEYVLLQGDRLYALGHFTTVSGSHQALNAGRDVGELLGEWKRDQAGLKARFDLDRDGEISPKEWVLARLAAKREVDRRHGEIRSGPVLHYLEKPGNGRLFLISNIPPGRLGRRYTLWAWFQVCALLAALLTLPWALQLQPTMQG